MSIQVLKAHFRKRLLSFLLCLAFSIILSIMLSSYKIAYLHSENVKSIVYTRVRVDFQATGKPVIDQIKLLAACVVTPKYLHFHCESLNEPLHL